MEGLPPSCRALSLARDARIYTVDVGKRLGTYRVDEDLLAAALVRATERGETVTDVIIRALCAYIRDSQPAGIVSAPPVAASLVYTDVESPVSYDEPAAAPSCKHPVGQVDPDTSICSCGADVW